MMQHPQTLPLAQQQHLAAAVRKHSAGAVARALGIGREQIVKLAAGFPVRPGTLALAQLALPRLDAALDPSANPSAA